MGMGMKSLKWEGIGTKNLFPHTYTPRRQPANLCVVYESCAHQRYAHLYEQFVNLRLVIGFD